MKCVASQSKLLQDIQKQNTNNACHFFLVMTASVLTDKFGFTREDTIRVLEAMQDRADSINKGYICLADLEQVLKDEYGITIGRSKK